MRNAGLDETQAGIKIAGRNINNLRYADDTTLMAESKELKSLSLKVKEESEKVKSKIMASGPITSWQTDGKTRKLVRLYFFGFQNHCRWWLQPWNKKALTPWKKSYDHLDNILKSRDVTLPTEVHLVKVMVFPVVMYVRDVRVQL